MAKQVGPLFITGTIDGVIFYKLNGVYLMRSKGDYKSGKQMRKDPRLKRTMQNADRFGGATKLVQAIYYRHLPKEVRKHGLFGKLTGMVNRWLYQGKTREEAEVLLIAYCKSLGTKTKAPSTTPALVKPLAGTTKQNASTQKLAQQPVAVLHNRKAKKARYLSQWKVKRSGRLQVPQRDTAILQLQPALKEEAKVKKGGPTIPFFS